MVLGRVMALKQSCGRCDAQQGPGVATGPALPPVPGWFALALRRAGARRGGGRWGRGRPPRAAPSGGAKPLERCASRDAGGGPKGLASGLARNSAAESSRELPLAVETRYPAR
jgi:hypothetical protein